MWIILCIAILFIIILHIVLPKQYNSPRDYWHIRKIPGPPTVPYIGSSYVFFVSGEDLIPVLLKLYEKYKPIFNVEIMGSNHVFLTDVNDIAIIFNGRKHTQKTDDYLFLIPWLGEGLLTSNNQKWFNHRRLLTPAFHFKILEQYTDIINKNARVLLNQIKIQTNNEYVTINPLITLCTLDIICETAMGTTVDAQVGGEKEYVKATLRMTQIIQQRMLLPWLFRQWIFDLTNLGREQKRMLKIVHGFTDKIIVERREIFRQEQLKKQTENEDAELYFGVKKKMSFLDLMIKMSETENKLTDQEIREEVDTFMFEGHDTTSAALCWSLFELGHHPEIQEQAYQEQLDIFGNSLRNADSSDLQAMKYLERVIKEALRLYPSVPLISRQTEEDIKIRGYLIPAGTHVPAFIYYFHRDPKAFPDPLKFDPDRFLTDQILNRHPYSYIPFSAGLRNCIGQKFAEMEEKIILSHIIRNYKIRSLDSREDVKINGELILRSKYDIRIKFEPR